DVARARSRLRRDAPAFRRGRRDAPDHRDRDDERAQPHRGRDAPRAGEERLNGTLKFTLPQPEERRVSKDGRARERPGHAWRSNPHTSLIFVTCSSKAGRAATAAYQRSTLAKFGRSGTRSR